MSGSSKDNIVGQIAVAVVVALLVGGTAPWWWREVFPERADRPQPTQMPPQPPRSTPLTLPEGPVEQPNGCVVTIANPLVALLSEPSRLSQQLLRVPPGEYSTSSYQVVQFAGKDQGWFEIEADGRTGWIADDVFTVDSKTAACP